VVVLPLYQCYSRCTPTTLNRVGDQDWLDTGHGGGEGLQPMISGTTRRVVDRVSIRSVLRGGEVAKARQPRRRTKALVGWLLYCCTAVGGTAAAFTVRDTLFPSLGAPTRTQVWASSSADTTLSTEHGSTAVPQVLVADSETTALPTTASTPAESVEENAGPSATDANQGPGNSVDNRGPGNVPQTGTTVAGPHDGPGPGTTVGDPPTDTSTPGSASTPPTSADATSTTPSTPGTPDDGTSPNKGNGGGGGGGGGGDSGGGGGDDPPTP
jgi:uncharacterized membrane protein YgcG